MVRLRHGGQAEGEHRPNKLARRDPDTWSDFCQDNLAGHLADDVATSPGDIDQVELIAVHLQVFFHARDVGVGDIGLVEVLDEVSQAEDEEDEEVESLYECHLLF